MQVKPTILSARLIPAPHTQLLSAFGISSKQNRSFGLISTDLEHALYVALDEATKASPVSILYAKSLFPDHRPNTPLSGEAMGVLIGDDDDIVREGMKSAVRTLEETVFYSTTETATKIRYFSHVIPSLGLYLSKEAGLVPGESMAYLIAPPIESIVALDDALKSAQVSLVKHFAPPTISNFGGGFVTGDLFECQAAARAFATKIEDIALSPRETLQSYSFETRKKR